MTVRVLHERESVDSTDDDLVSWAARSRAAQGCTEAAVFRAVDAPERVVVLELWSDEAAYAANWAAVREEKTTRALLSAPAPGDAAAGSEFYRHARFDRADGVWVPEGRGEEPRTIRWPSSGAVRAISLSSSDPADHGPWPGSPEAAAETRREPGCLQFRAYRGLEHPQDIVLLELWTDQIRYDLHWRLRLEARASGTVAGGGNRSGVPRGIGANGMEFYHHRSFVHLYDRWAPEESDAWSQTVVWPA